MDIRRSTHGPARPWLLGSLLAATLAVAGCAQGTGDDESSPSSFKSDEKLSGQLDVMGFGAGRRDRAPPGSISPRRPSPASRSS